MTQLSWSLSDEVAPLFNAKHIEGLCILIDEKANKGLKYNDLKEQLLNHISSIVPLNDPDDYWNPFRRAYEFTKYY